MTGRFQPCASQAFLYPRTQPDPKAATVTAIVRVLNNIMGSDLCSFAENAVPHLLVQITARPRDLRELTDLTIFRVRMCQLCASLPTPLIRLTRQRREFFCDMSRFGHARRRNRYVWQVVAGKANTLIVKGYDLVHPETGSHLVRRER